MKRLRLEGPAGIVLKEGGEEHRTGDEFEVTNDRAQELLAAKGLSLSMIKRAAEAEPANDGKNEGGKEDGTV